MSLDRLSPNDIEVVRQCLSAAVDGPFFPEWEFHTLMGLTRERVAATAAEWPECTDEESRDVAVSNVLNNLLGYPHNERAAWNTYITVSQDEVAGVLARWRGEEGFDPSGSGYANELW